MKVRLQSATLYMYIAYLDESGTHAEARYFVVAGLAVFERETYFLSQSLDQIQAQKFPQETEPINFHVAALRAPQGRLVPPFDSLSDNERKALIRSIYDVIENSKVRIFAVAMEKASINEPYERGFEEIMNRFDRMLGRMLRDTGEPQRGLIVIAESSYRENLALLAQRIWKHGHRWGETHNMADIPYFAPAKSTRLLQLADFIANAVFGRYESGYSRDFDKIAVRIDQEGGRLHGLVHLASESRSCYCPACITRRSLPRAEHDELPT